MARKAKALSLLEVEVIQEALKLFLSQPKAAPHTKLTVGAQMQLTPAGTTDLYKLMERKRLVARTKSPQSEKGIYLKLTKEGRAFVKAWDTLYS